MILRKFGHPAWCCTILLLWGPLAYAQQQQAADAYDGEKNWEQVCRQAKTIPLPKAPTSGPLDAKQLTKCDERALYYGWGSKPDYAAALQCGWYEYAHPDKVNANMFAGPGVLAMLYANGKGVERNDNLALRFACEMDWAAEAEMALRIGHLEYRKKINDQSSDFDLCADITSGLNQGACTSIQTSARDAGRDKKIAAISSGFSPAVQSLFRLLQQAESNYEAARIGGEVDLSGTARAAFQLDEEAILRDQFLINLQRFGRGGIPNASDSDLAEQDRKLNEAYQQALKAAAKDGYSTIKPEGIRDTERKWLKLVDAWMAFSKEAYPSLSATRIRTQLIRLRLHQLRSLAGAESQ